MCPFVSGDFLEIPAKRSLPVFYRMKPENISCEASVFPTENRGLFLNETSDDILEDCVIVDKFRDPRTLDRHFILPSLDQTVRYVRP